MSTKSSFKAAKERQAKIAANRQSQSASPTTKLVLLAGEIVRPVDLIRLLVHHGTSLKKARSVVDGLAEGRAVVVELKIDDWITFDTQLKLLDVTARMFATDDAIDAKSVREGQRLSQTEFAALYGLELDTLQNWEQGRYAPDSNARVLLKVIQRRPDAVVEALTEARHASK